MDLGYEQYCLADEWFYDSPTETRGDDVDFDLARRPVPSGWQQVPSDDWLVHWPVEGARTPAQGWKVHVSACLDNADHVLSAVFDYCVPRRIPFKFVRSRQLLLLRNAKYADRGASGKFVTIYPADEGELETVLTGLGERLAGQPGPYILSDLRIGDGPLYVRWGGFAERWCTGPKGTLELAVADPDGRLVPDVRGPCFSLPPWVEVPACLVPHLEARNRPAGEEFHYDIEEALHFSNGGGLYVATDRRTGRRVVLKEARPHAGLAFDGADAVSRLRNEAEVLRRLAGIDAVPEVHDLFTAGGHQFLALEYVEGSRLNDLMVQRFPLTAPRLDGAAMAAYAAWALDVLGQIDRAVAAVHERGVAILDLHPSNVLVRPDGRIVLVDFELAGDGHEVRSLSLADPGFMAPGRRTGFEVDRYALACFRPYLFLPLNNVFGMAPDKAMQLAEEIARLFPVPRAELVEAARTIAGDGPAAGSGASAVRVWRAPIEPDAAGWQRARASMVRAIVASATPGRDSRLFPGDVKQFSTGGLNLAYGAAGVLYALAAAGAGRFPDYEAWLLDRALRPAPGTRLGFYDGLHGVAYALDHLGHHREALELVEACTEELAGKADALGLDLLGGLAGVGLNLRHFAARAGDPSLRAEAVRVAEAVAGRLGGDDGVGELSGGHHPHAGLLRGSAGPALLFLRLFEDTGDPALLDLAEVAVRQDLRRCLRRDDGSLEVNEGWRTMPYLCDGSVGIGMVLDDLLRHRPDEELAAAAAAIRRAAQSAFYIEPGLFYGRAGMILYLSRDRRPGAGELDPVVADHVRRLSWHALAYKGELAFPGEQLLRLSMDLASGTAGVLLAMAAALHDRPAGLPFLEPAAVPTSDREPVPA